jgi:hypothetical protein
VTPLELGRLILESDPQFRRVAPGRVEALVAAALEDGAALAHTMPCRDPRRLAETHGLAVIEATETGDFGTTIVFADYQPGRIRLYRATLDRLSALAGEDVTPIFLAHEIYHHLDQARPVPLARQHRVTILGPWTSDLASLAEIAAGAFAQTLLALPYHPKRLELMAIEAWRSAVVTGG